ncbi:MAG: radical SAM protein [Deltaproteobacteria bacterium]|nr:radical SAM protein [Deltaproteobacteria bacterium]
MERFPVPPAYLALWERGELQKRAEEAEKILRACRLCARRCGVDRTRGERGFCRAGLAPAVSSSNVHHGEEPPISGSGGSGTIFLTHCNLRCVFCQNYPISQLGVGKEESAEDLGRRMLDLQGRGCHNINLVTPTHFVPQILKALCRAVEGGLRLPLVYNTNGYDSPEALGLLEGIVDIYLPDMKYSGEEAARRYSQAPGYPAANRAAVREMFRQVGEGVYGGDGTMRRGLIIRHLLLPEDLAGTEGVARFIAEELSPRCFISLMTQFFPAYQAADHPPLGRRLKRSEFARALRILHRHGLQEGWRQEPPG